MHRRDWLRLSGATAASLTLGGFPLGCAQEPASKPKQAKKPHVLFFTRSAGFPHPTITRKKPDELSWSEQVLTQLGRWHGFDVTCTKDGRVFIPEELAKYDAIFFYTTGVLTNEKSPDGTPPMPPSGKKALLDYVASGKGFLGSHCASDTFHTPQSPGEQWQNQAPEKLDPYIAMLGGEFVSHGAQQKARMQIVSPSFPGADTLKDFTLHEEWYSLKNFAPDLHVILAQTTEGMKGRDYQRPAFPATWARKHGDGRVFYTSMGHREDVWTNPLFQQILLGGLNWALKRVEVDITPNMDQVTPHARELQTKKS
jgi:hypothetical protein